MEAVVWLEDYLSKWNKILFMVSHSQDFLNNVCTHMVHLFQKKLILYTGNYDQFCQTRAEKDEEQEKRYKLEQDQINHMKEYVARFGQGNAKMAKQAQSKEKVLDKMLKGGLTDKVVHEKPLDFKFNDPGKLSPPVLQCNDITFGYPGCEILYSGVDFGVDLDSRVALVGPNGAGKTTLLKIMTGELMPVTGAVRPHAHLRISKFTQHFVDVLDLDKTPLEYFMHLWPDLSREDGRKFLGRFGISGSVQTQIMGQLSDGQKSRVVLAKMAKENPHMLFLDEVGGWLSACLCACV
jgi:ATP-binding cassette subfamily F protein 2